MRGRKVSVIVTVLNEEESVSGLLDSLINQSVRPDEIIVADGGSRDGTIEIIEGYSKEYKFLRLMKLQKASISEGRNAAIKAAKYSVIAQIDGGCVAKKDWLEKITEPFGDKSVGLVAGFYEMQTKTNFSMALAPFMGTPKKWFDHRCFMPSGRSVAFRKSVWEQVGGYSQDLDRAGEDTLFNYRVLRAEIKIVRARSAMVYWEVPDSYSHAAKKFYSYAKGDAQAAIWWHPAQGLSTHNIKILSIFARYTLFGILAMLSLINSVFLAIFIIVFAMYTWWSIWKMREVVDEIKAKVFIPVVQFTSDITVMAGFATGLVSYYYK